MNRLLRTMTKMTVLTAFLFAVGTQAYASNESFVGFDNVYPNIQLSDSIDKKLSYSDKQHEKNKQEALEKMKAFYDKKDAERKAKPATEHKEYWSGGLGEEPKASSCEVYTSKEIINLAHQFNKILDENGYYFYTEAVLYTDSLDSEDLFKTEYPRMTNDAIKVFLKDFADFLEGKIENERYSIIKTVKNKKEHYYIANVKYNVAVGSHYFLRMKIDKKERVITLL